MYISKPRFTFILILIFCAGTAFAQQKPVGYWESFLPYNTAIGVATDGYILYAICNQAFFTYDNSNGVYQTYSKVEGMSDIGMQCIGFDKYTSKAILCYSDGNIDLFKNNTFYNLPGFKNKVIPGAKIIYQVYTENGFAYLSTSQGVIVIDLTNQIITETIQLYDDAGGIIPVNSFGADDTFFYEATPNGLFRASKNSPDLQNYQFWQLLDTLHFVNDLAKVNNSLYLSNNHSVFELQNDTLHAIYSDDSGISYICEGNNRLLVGVYSGDTIAIIDSNNNLIDAFSCQGSGVQAVQLANNSIWFGRPFEGLTQRMNDVVMRTFFPDGPSDGNIYDLYSYNKDLYIAHGGYNDLYLPNSNPSGISYLHNGSWTHYTRYLYPPFNNVTDLITVLRDEATGIVYSGSLTYGLFIMEPNNTCQEIQQNSIFDTSSSFYGLGQRTILNLALDQSDNLWMSSFFEYHQLYVKSADSTWYAFKVPGMTQGGPMVIDDNGQIWLVSDGNEGIAVYNTNNTLKDLSDDHSYHLVQGVGSGNLPSNNAKCIAKDLNNNIWIGTDNGIAIVSNCTAPFTNTPPCDAEIPIVQYDQYAGYLFAGYNVSSIAVDGANRKWVGTDNGIWLLSPDASSIVYYFTVDNSPLPSNNIIKINIDQITGDVYIGTDQGLISYRSTATQGNTSNQNVIVFPDPVPSGYSGSISIKGLVTDADVRITDISGKLVFRTTAFGGQAVWNGMDYTGHRPQSGVYLVFVTSSDGSQTYSGKLVFIQ